MYKMYKNSKINFTFHFAFYTLHFYVFAFYKLLLTLTIISNTNPNCMSLRYFNCKSITTPLVLTSLGPLNFTLAGIRRYLFGGIGYWWRTIPENIRWGGIATYVFSKHLHLARVANRPEWPGSSRNWPTVSRVPGEAHFVPEMWKLTTGHGYMAVH